MSTAAIIAIAQIFAQYGLPAAQLVYGWIKDGKQEITPADWAILEKLSAYRSTDALTAAGIRVVDGKVVKLDGTPLL